MKRNLKPKCGTKEKLKGSSLLALIVKKLLVQRSFASLDWDIKLTRSWCALPLNMTRLTKMIAFNFFSGLGPSL